MGLTVVDFDLVEANEAFAAKLLTVVQELSFTYFRNELMGLKE